MSFQQASCAASYLTLVVSRARSKQETTSEQMQVKCIALCLPGMPHSLYRLLAISQRKKNRNTNVHKKAHASFNTKTRTGRWTFAAARKGLTFSFLNGLPKGNREQGGNGQCHLLYQTLQGIHKGTTSPSLLYINVITIT